MSKFVIYTAIFGSPGRFNIPEVSIRKVDKICYTDLDVKEGCDQMIPVRKGRMLKNDFYDIKIIARDEDMTSVMQQRFMKIIIPDEIFDNYEYSAYVDCKRPIRIDFEHCEKLLNMEPRSDFLTRKHPKRDCIYKEAEFCISKKGKKGNVRDIEKQIDFYRSERYPKHNGLYFTHWLFRRHTSELKKFSNLWWEQLIEFSHRDQISLPYIARKCGVGITT